ncbi:hypothetical protein DFH08DRAFT_812249 [Mycena albidolilacea]|uniref:Uncharacterized protein n=1 Tax=Mycena albidolilacea TaxID=1033008 RepID=A0AAD6ZU94_9AGAR|nr:hypothetical protein DFH08DRAFT_812249 [Mycena albidolilacea]
MKVPTNECPLVQHILKHPVWLSQHQLPESSHFKEINQELVDKSLLEADIVRERRFVPFKHTQNHHDVKWCRIDQEMSLEMRALFIVQLFELAILWNVHLVPRPRRHTAIGFSRLLVSISAQSESSHFISITGMGVLWISYRIAAVAPTSGDASSLGTMTGMFTCLAKNAETFDLILKANAQVKKDRVVCFQGLGVILFQVPGNPASLSLPISEDAEGAGGLGYVLERLQSSTMAVGQGRERVMVMHHREGRRRRSVTLWERDSSEVAGNVGNSEGR